MKDLIICTIISLVMALVFYVAMTGTLCQRINIYDHATQESMRLNSSECSRPWFKKL